MTNDEHTSDPLNTEALVSSANDLTKALDVLGQDIRRLEAYGRRNRSLILATIFMAVVTFVLSVGLGIVAFSARHANQRTAALTRRTAELTISAQARCDQGNQTRATILTALDELLNEAAAVSKTPPQPGVLASFETQLAQKLAPVKC